MESNDCQTIIPPPKSWLSSTSSCNFYSCVFDVVLHCHTQAFAQHHIYLIMSRCNASQSSSSLYDSHHSQLLLQSASNDSNSGDEDNSSINSDGDSSSADENKKLRALPPAVRFETIEVGNNNKMEQEDGGFPLPINDQNSNYTWTPINTGERLQVMTDFTLACQKACRKIWCTASTDNTDDSSKQVFHGICSYHAWNAWQRNNRNQFRRYDKNKKRMGVDFEQFKCCPWITLVPLLRDKMIHKWSTIYKERKATHAWAKQWSSCAVTKVEQNQQGLLRGGIPCHNNNSEGRNHGDKLFFWP